MVGIGCMMIPVSSLSGIPPIFVTFLSNGLAMGVVTCILIEQGMRIFDGEK
jgi:xanthine/uracil permease